MDGYGNGHGLGVHALHQHVTNSHGGKDQFHWQLHRQVLKKTFRFYIPSSLKLSFLPALGAEPCKIPAAYCKHRTELNPWLFHLRHPNLVTIDQPSNSTARCLFSKVDTALILWPPKRTKGMYSRKWYLLSLPWFIIVRWNMSLIPSGRQLNFLSCGREIPVSTQPWSYELWEVQSLAIRRVERSDWLGDSLIDGCFQK